MKWFEAYAPLPLVPIRVWGFSLLAVLPLFPPQLGAQGGYSIMENVPGETRTHYFWCIDGMGQVTWNCWIELYGPAPYNDSGGHLHNTGRPSSQYNPNFGYYENWEGWATQVDSTHNVGQWEYFEVGGWAPITPFDLWVRHYPFWEIGSHTSYLRLIGATDWHPKNHFGTAFLVSSVDEVARQYHGEFYCVTTQQDIWGYQPVGVNDMSLEGGGIFDIKQHLGAQYRWNPPHSYHSGGNSVDFRCQHHRNYSIIYHPPIIERFMEICDQKELEYVLPEDLGTSNGHIHCGKWEGN